MAAKNGQAKPIVLAVTVLTSLNDDDLREIGFAKNTNDSGSASGDNWRKRQVLPVLWLRRRILPHCAAELGDDFILVTPGIRSSQETVKDDQKRTLSALDAVKLGADYIVVGRPIRQAADPLAVLPEEYCSGDRPEWLPVKQSLQDGRITEISGMEVIYGINPIKVLLRQQTNRVGKGNCSFG